MSCNTIYTIGHSTRSAQEFSTLLTRHHIETVVDVRSYPSSRRCPQFNQDEMRDWLEDYRHIPNLGGRRKKGSADPNTINGWTHPSFSNYAGYMQTAEFQAGLDDLMNVARSSRVAYMCSESVWWKCHRRMISDAIVARGWTVLHIMDGGLSKHKMTEFAVVRDSDVIYPPDQFSLSLCGCGDGLKYSRSQNTSAA